MNTTKFELVEETQSNGQVWYKVMENDLYVYGSLTRDLEEANKTLDKCVNGHKYGTINRVIKTIEVNETHKTD